MFGVSVGERDMTRAQVLKYSTAPEAAFVRALCEVRATDWFHQLEACGVMVDFTFPFSRLAVFIDECAWHGCKAHGDPRKLRGKQRKKIEGVMARDRSKELRLRAYGWRVMRIWEHELKTDGLAIVQAMQARVLARWLRPNPVRN